MRRFLVAIVVGALLLGLAAPGAEAHGWGLGAAIVGLATFAVFAPIVVAGTVIAHAVPPVYAPPPAYAPPPGYAPPPAYAPPPGYAPAPAYAPPSATYAPPPAYAARVSARTTYRAASAAENVVQYATGRYVLRGDGVTTAYRWVWIPNPPPPPPAHPPQLAGGTR